MMDYYVLDGQTPRRAVGLVEWAENRTLGHWRVDFYEANGVRVSTVFLGLDHGYGDEGLPILFETLVFEGPLDGEMERCATWDEAVAQHAEMVRRVKEAGT